MLKIKARRLPYRSPPAAGLERRRSSDRDYQADGEVQAAPRPCALLLYSVL